MPLGEAGTEQFEIVVEIDGNVVGRQPIHDPFINNRTQIVMSRWACFKGLFKCHRIVTVDVHVNGTPGAVAAITNMDPEDLIEDTRRIIRERARQRDKSVGGRHFEGRSFE